jgi:uroporphyrin-3 C-methyltransferase
MSAENTKESQAEKKPDPPADAKTKAEKGEAAKQPVKKAKATRVKKAGSNRTGPTVLAWLALLLALGAAGGGYYAYSLVLANKPIIASHSQQIASLSKQLEEVNNSLSGAHQRLEDEVAARKQAEAEHEALATKMATLEAKLGRTTLAWRLAEAEYLLTLANQRLNLEHDQATAISILETVDAKLRALGDPALLPVREKISDELAQLRAVEVPDITGMALTLASLAQASQTWPLRDKTPPGVLGSDEAPRSRPLSWQEIPRAVWEDLKDMVRVRRHQQPVEPLLPPDQFWFLRQNLQLKLEQARLALLRRDKPLFDRLLSEAQDWARLFFDGNAASVSSAVETLDHLKTAELRPALPDISASLRELRAQSKRLGQQVEATGESAP